MVRSLLRVFALTVALLAWPSASPLAAARVYAAASLQGALEDAADTWVREGGERPLLVHGASSALARQLEQGAPGDLYVSADEAWMDRLETLGRIRPGTRVRLFGNRLVLVAPAGSSAPAIGDAAALAGAIAAGLGEGGRLAIADVDAVPAGRYARQALESLGAWPAVSGRLARSADVRAALALVARGEAPLGLVFASDALAEPRVRVLATVPASAHAPIVYPAAVLSDSSSPDAAALLAFLQSDRARRVFAAHGFVPVEAGRGRPDESGGTGTAAAPSAAPTWSDDEALDALRLSLKVAAVATLAALPFAIAVATLLVRGRFRGRSVLDAAVHLPLVLPPVVTGYVLLVAFGRQGPIGAWLEANLGLVLSFRWTGAALASAVMGFPLMVRAIRLSLEAIDPRLSSAAATLGAPPAWQFATVVLPLALPGVLAGAVLCFAKALGEFGATITFVSSIPGETRTLPAAIYAATQTPGGDATALRLSAIAVAVSVGALLLSEWLARRVRRSIGRPG